MPLIDINIELLPSGKQFPKNPRFIQLDGLPAKKTFLNSLITAPTLASTLLMTTSAATAALAADGNLSMLLMGISVALAPMTQRKLSMAQEFQNHFYFGCEWQDKIIDKAPETDSRSTTPKDHAAVQTAAINSCILSLRKAFSATGYLAAGALVSGVTSAVTQEPSLAGIAIAAPFACRNAAHAVSQHIAFKRYVNVMLGEWDLISRQEAERKTHLAEAHARAAQKPAWSWLPSPQPVGANAMAEPQQPEMKLTA